MAKGSMIRYLPLFAMAALFPFYGTDKNIPDTKGMVLVPRGGPIYIPRRGKLKGWQKELRRNKHYNKFG